MVTLAQLGQKLTPKTACAGVMITNLVCRPIITMSNKNVPLETRRYAATREGCTEAFGLANTLILGTALEMLAARWGVKHILKQAPSKELLKEIASKSITQLTDSKQKIKAIVLFTSLAASALASAVVTPLLNNLVVGKVIEKLLGKKSSEQKTPEQNNNVANKTASTNNTFLKDSIFKKFESKIMA